MTHRLFSAALAALLLAVALAPVPAVAQERVDERFVYEWKLRKLASLLGGIFLPGSGVGSLTVEADGGQLRSELHITSPESGDGEYWRYGALIDPERGRTLRAWSSYYFRDEKKSKQEDISQSGVVDVASGIYLIRQDPPEGRRPMRIWSDGKIYPVVVIPRGTEFQTLPGGRRVATTRYSIEGDRSREGREWKGSMELWLAHDEAATPVVIEIKRAFAGVRLELTEGL
jgi:hypothetical protein